MMAGIAARLFVFFVLGATASMILSGQGHTFSTLSAVQKLLFSASIAASAFVILRLQSWNERLAFAKPRPIDPTDEVVVITGGSGGLGKELAILYAAGGVKVAILDVTPYMKSEHENVDETNVKWYQCDVGDYAAVQEVKERIRHDFGDPTILINNAGIMIGKTLLSLTSAEIERTIRVNLLAHFNCIHAFLPAMLARTSGGTIVTIASVLGHLGAAQLSDYAASKAGLLAMHASLVGELSNMSVQENPGARNVKMILVKPGQLSTPLFEGMPTPSKTFGPIVNAAKLAAKITKKVDAGCGGVIAEPMYARFIEVLAVLPYSLQRFVRFVGGIDRAMSKMGRTRGHKS